MGILLSGVEKWNEWIIENIEMVPDLSGGDLSEENLSKRYFRGANLGWADLSRANLFRADLSEANLLGANLSGATLFESILNAANLNKAVLTEVEGIGADLRKATLFEADLRNSNFSGANFEGANLSGALLSNAHFDRANLHQAILHKANLGATDLTGATLTRARLNNATLTDATLRVANLSYSELNGANFSGANLNGSSLNAARLIDTVLDGSNLTNACLWETQRAGWSIKGVICESIYWDKDRKEKTRYQPGEFERLFAEKTKVRLFYKNGINPFEIATLPALIKHLEDYYPNCALRLVSIHEDSGGAVVELSIHDDSLLTTDERRRLKSALEAEAHQRVEYQRQALMERETRLQVEARLEELRSCFHLLANKNPINLQGDYVGNTYNISGQAGAVGSNAHAHDNTFNQIANHLQSVDMAELAKQLGELRQAMTEREGSSPQTAIAVGELAKAEIAAQEKKPSKVVEHLKAAGQWTLDFAKEIGKDVAVEAIKQSMGA